MDDQAKEQALGSGKAKISKLAIVSLILGLISLCVLFIKIPYTWCGTCHVSIYMERVLPLRFVAVLAIISGLIVLLKYIHKQLNNTLFALCGIVCALLSFLGPRDISTPASVLCRLNLSGMSKAMILYAGDFNDMLPIPEKWCDLLVEYADCKPKQFLCGGSDNKVGESSYAFNVNLKGKNVYELDSNVVLIFETNEVGWNLCGGKELISCANHNGEICNVILADSRTKRIRCKDINSLNWGVEGEE